MATVPASRPDLAAHREALRLPISEIVKQLIGLIGRKLTAYIGGVRDVRAVDRWMSGSELYGDAEQRLRFAFQLVRMLSEREDPAVIQSWLTGLNPELGDRVPLRLMRENDLEKVAPEIMGAARAFLLGGSEHSWPSKRSGPRGRFSVSGEMTTRGPLLIGPMPRKTEPSEIASMTRW